ncbi:tyrosine-type recombinase/integrase [Kitasatospora sp. NPDC051164]|uniref:tyrosine-type recombinase/integrase n=1 Tax=Kitasatospora sp. NPDC051164 TaxID=3364055 RepID=UPI0037A641A8
MRAFRVQLPSGAGYWTVLDEELAVVPAADAFLRYVRFGKDQAELTTRTYAGHVALYLRWCARTGRDWRTAAQDLGLFTVWLKYGTPDATGIERPVAGRGVVMAGPGTEPHRQPGRIGNVLTGVRQFLLHAITTKSVPSEVLVQLYEVAEDWDLPEEARGEGMSYRLKARHRVQVPRKRRDRATDAEAVALFMACHNARDRFIVLLLARAGLRRGTAAGLRREDMHFMPDSTALGCRMAGSHLHVLRRENPNGAWAKRQQSAAPGKAKPVDFLVVQAHDQYVIERMALPHGAASDFVLVNLFAEPLGAPMSPDGITELLQRLSRRAGLSRIVTPHMLRHAMASNVVDAGGSLDEVAALLDHARLSSAEPYLHPDPDRLRQAVDRVPSPRELAGGLR